MPMHTATPLARQVLCDPRSDPGAETWIRYRASGDPLLREQLVSLYTPYARIIAARMYRRRGRLAAGFSDYMQSALLGLLRAIDRYDPALAIPFIHFSGRHIRGAVLDALPSLSELNAQVLGRHSLRRAHVATMQGEGCPAQDGASAEPPGGPAQETWAGFPLDDASAFRPLTEQLDHRCQEDLRQRELAAAFAQLLPLLPERLSRLLRCHYFQQMRFVEIAQAMGLSPARVSQLHRQALKTLLHLSRSFGHLELDG